MIKTTVFQLDKPRVSIGLPVYNGEAFLAEAIESLLAQTFDDFELIISDNGSSDGTQDICRAYAAKDVRIRYYREAENRGAAWNYNRVFELARGEYFKWAAHDDIHAPTFLARCADVLDHNPDVHWCFSRHTHVDRQGRPLANLDARDISYRRADGWDRSSSDPVQRFRSVMLGGSSCLDFYGLHRREVLAKTGLYQPYYGSDKVLVTELMHWGRYAEISETLFFVRVHPEASGCIETEAQLQYYIDPKARQRFMFTRMRILKGHAAAIRRARLPAAHRLRCYFVLVQYVLQFEKWGHVAKSLVRRQGTGGGYREHMTTMKEKDGLEYRNICMAEAAPQKK